MNNLLMINSKGDVVMRLKDLVQLVIMASVVVYVSSSFAATATVDGITWTYTVSNGKATIGGGSSSSTAVPKSTSGALSIPSSLGGYPVTGIGAYAFCNCTNLTSVTMPDSVTNIALRAFSGCSGFTRMAIPNSVVSIGSGAFSGCFRLTSITLPFVGSRRGNSGSEDSVFGYVFGTSSYSYGVQAQQWYSSVSYTYYYIPYSLGEVVITDEAPLGYGAFSGCSRLTSVTIPDSVTNLSSWAFSGCRGLTRMVIPNGVTSIGDSAFSGCIGLMDVTIPDSVTSVGDSAFSGCSGFARMAIPNSVVSIGDSAFSDCIGLMDVTIPDSVTKIGASAFNNCRRLTDVTISGSVTIIGADAFYGCASLSHVYVSDLASWCRISFENPNANPLSWAHNLYLGGAKVTNLIVPSEVASVGKYAFCGCSGLASVTIPDSVTSIGDYAFWGCSGLASVTIPDSVTSIRSGVFASCSSLTSVAIPNSVTGIGSGAFSDCSGLACVAIPNRVTSIGSSAFSRCSGLTSMTIPDSVTGIGSSAFSGCSGLTSVTIPNSVTSIGASAFAACRGLTSMVLPFVGSRRGISGSSDSVFGYIFGTSSYSGSVQTRQYFSSNSSSTYYLPSSLKEVVITDETKLGYGAFYGCSGLTSVTISNCVTSIGKSAFYNCSGLARMTIPYSVKSIEESAFSNCSGVGEIVFGGDAPSVGTDAFSGVNSECTARVLLGSSGWGCDIPGVWEGLRIDYTIPYVLFTGNGGSVGVSELATNDGVIDGELPEASRIGYTFVGWFPEVAGGDEILSGMVLEGSVRAYAHWTANEYAVSFDPNGGQVSMSEIKVHYDSKYGVLPEPARIGYSFAGWRLNGANVIQNTIVRTASDHVLTAAWTANRYSVTYNPNGGSVSSSSKTVTFDSAYGQLPVPTRTGYTFAGWLLGDEIVSANTVVATAGNHELVAQWTVNQYLVTFNANGGVGGTSALMDYGADIIAPVVVREGCTFDGWSSAVPATVPAYDVTFTAKWKVWDVKVDSIENTLKVLYPNDYQRITNVVLVSGITEIPEKFFDGCSSLASVTMPDSVMNIGPYAFRNCRELIELEIPNCVTNIGSYAFYGCSGLTSVTIPEGVESVGDYALKNCRSLIVAYVPERLRGKLSANVFEGCHSDFAIFYYPYTMRDGGAASWRVDPDNLHGDDEQSLRSGAIGNEEESWLEMTVPRAGRLSFWWKASSEHDGDSVFDGAYLSIDDEPVGGLDADSYALWGVAVGGETGWTNVVLDIVGKGPHKIRWTYRKDEVDEGSVGDDCVWVSGIEFDPEPFSFAECLNDAELSVTTEGDLPWGRIQEAAQSHDGVASLRSGAIGNDQSSTLKIQVDGAGDLSFWWKVSSERTVRNKRHDGCSFLVDGTEKLYMDGTTNDWQMVMVTIEGDGAHELTWTYQKDASDNNEVGEDCAWLDEVVWVPHIDPIPVVALDATPDVVTNAIDFAGFADTAVKAAIGGSAAEYNAFKTWADGVKGVTGDALAGEAAVVANEHAAAAYLLGAERLFEYEPTVEIGELSIGEGENAGTTAMAVVVTVKDGEMVVAVDAEKVAAMFEATSDLGDWTGAAKLMPTVTTTGIDANGKMTFVVTPGDGTASKAFLRIRR